jgi:hypothetical protein
MTGQTSHVSRKHKNTIKRSHTKNANEKSVTKGVA